MRGTATWWCAWTRCCRAWPTSWPPKASGCWLWAWQPPQFARSSPGAHLIKLLDRIDNVKTLAYAVLARLRELNVRAVGTVPALFETLTDEVDTNFSPALVSQLLARDPSRVQLEAVTLPTRDVPGSGRFVTTVPGEVEGAT